MQPLGSPMLDGLRDPESEARSPGVPTLPPKVRDILEILRRDGWYQVAQKGSHRQLKHPRKPGRVTVSGHPGKDLHPFVHRSILKQAGLRK